jgi:hypothetical protein
MFSEFSENFTHLGVGLVKRSKKVGYLSQYTLGRLLLILKPVK